MENHGVIGIGSQLVMWTMVDYRPSSLNRTWMGLKPSKAGGFGHFSPAQFVSSLHTEMGCLNIGTHKFGSDSMSIIISQHAIAMWEVYPSFRNDIMTHEYVYIYICIYIYMYIYICIYIYMYTYVYVYIDTHTLYIYIYTYIYIYIYTCMYTYIYIYTYTCNIVGYISHYLYPQYIPIRFPHQIPSDQWENPFPTVVSGSKSGVPTSGLQSEPNRPENS